MTTSFSSSEHQPGTALPVLVGALSHQPELDIIKFAVARFVAQRRDWYLSAGLKPKDSPSFDVSTLLQALAWESLDRLDTRDFTADQFRALLEQLLDSPAARALGRELHEALGWDNEIDAQDADPQLLKQLVWSALILEIDPPARHKIAHVAGYDLTAKRTWGRPLRWIRADLISFLEWKTRGVDGLRSYEMASLALCALEPLIPEFARNDIPAGLPYGSLRWANFAHGVALAEALQPGASQLLGFEQLLELPLEQSDQAGPDVLQVIAATRLLPALQWAIAHERVDHRPDAAYSEEDVQRAIGALDDYSARLARSTLAVLRDPPHRIRMAEQLFNELMGDKSYLHQTVMRPSTVWGRIEFSLKNPAPSVRAGEFYLLDVFAAGYLKNGLDQFEPHLQHNQTALRDAIVPAIEKLKGVDIPALYDTAFDAWFEQAQAGYKALVEHLLEQIPPDDQERLNTGEVTVIVLRRETGKALQSETAQDRADHQGRFGFMIRCEHDGKVFFYELFPFRSQLKRRADLGVIPRSRAEVQYVDWAPALIQTDWATYRENREPEADARCAVIPVQIGYFPASCDDSPPAAPSQRLKAIAEVVVQRNMFCDRQRTYQVQRGVTGVELVSGNYPPVLRLAEVLIPGLGCYNAVRTGESAALSCVLDVGAIMALPLFTLGKGVLQVSVRSGRIGLLKALPAFGGAARQFVKASGVAYRQALNPIGLGIALGSALQEAGQFSRVVLKRMTARMNTWARLSSRAVVFRMPQRVNGRIGYPLSGRGAAAAAVALGADDSGRRIRNVRDYDAFLDTDDIFKGNARLRADMLAEVEAGADIRVHVRRDGSRTLVKKDQADQVFVDLADNSTVHLTSHYDYRVLKSWATGNESGQAEVKRLAVNRVVPSRRVLDPQRLRSVKDAIENGNYLPPLDVRRMGEGFEVVNGNHRLQAAVELELENVPAVILPQSADSPATSY
ncbi:ParB N-terminal domain-containing protein [Pseudomonas sp. v388]|uniref:ParB N-terminal domain-containing protein n=1 Tax=Pseudomonas sp. v388 TaxID=2479849 RepID=UPI0013157822|nr:ParB N-terminal domain-containing protein [Pseudomonas sp. v388]